MIIINIDYSLAACNVATILMPRNEMKIYLTNWVNKEIRLRHFISRRHVNNQNAVSLLDNPDASDIQGTNYYNSQSSTNMNVGYKSLVVSNNQKHHHNHFYPKQMINANLNYRY